MKKELFIVLLVVLFSLSFVSAAPVWGGSVSTEIEAAGEGFVCAYDTTTAIWIEYARVGGSISRNGSEDAILNCRKNVSDVITGASLTCCPEDYICDENGDCITDEGSNACSDLPEALCTGQLPIALPEVKDILSGYGLDINWGTSSEVSFPVRDKADCLDVELCEDCFNINLKDSYTMLISGIRCKWNTGNSSCEAVWNSGGGCPGDGSSTAHGAGRVMSRHAALKYQRGEDVQKKLEEKGIDIEAGSSKGLAEEAPEAYKDVDEVVNVSDKVGIGKLVVKLKPLAVMKG